MNNKKGLIIFLVLIFTLFFISENTLARGRSFSRSGVASRGSFSARRNYRPPQQFGNRAVQQPVRRQQRPVTAMPQNTNRPTQVQRTNRMAATSPNRISPEKSQQLAQNRNTADRSSTAENKGGLEDRQEWRDQNREDIQQEIGDRQENRQEFAKDKQEDRQDFVEDVHDDHHDWDDHWDGDDGEFVAGMVVGGVMVGAAAAAADANDNYDQPTTVYNNTTTYVTAPPCDPRETTINGVTYFICGNQWYKRSYAGSQVTFIPVNPPPGY